VAGQTRNPVHWGIRGATQFHQIMLGRHMAPLPTRVEAVYTDDDADPSGRLLRAEATFGKTRPALHAIDVEFRAQLMR
jgi:hypothetical protein